MPKVFLCIVAVLVVTGVSLMAQPPIPAAPQEVLVKFRTLAPGVLQQIAQDEDLDMVKGVGGNGALRFRSRSKSTDALMARLRSRADILYVEPNAIVSAIAEPNDPSYPSLWGMAKISAPSAWDVSTGSQGTVVGVIDTGVDYTHPDLAANIWSAPTAFSVTIGGRTLNCPAGSHGYNAIRETCDPMDDNNHGTHVSGTIGAVGNNSLGVVGVNWSTSILGIKFLGASGSGYTSDAADGIEFAIQMKGKGFNVRVLSNSWGGGGFSQTLLDEITHANTAGILFVAAAGNDGQNIDGTKSYPASYDVANVIAVAATDSNDQLASWSNYGSSTVDLAAPGVGILSTIRRNRYDSYSGTSMATPHVSGAAALILSACGSVNTVNSLVSTLLNSADEPGTLGGKVANGRRLNVYNAVKNCGGSTPTPDFTISASPTSAKISSQETATYSVTATTSPVTWNVSGCPTDAKCSFSSDSASATLTVQPNPTITRGNYTLTIIGTSGSMVRTTTVKLTVLKR